MTVQQKFYLCILRLIVYVFLIFSLYFLYILKDMFRYSGFLENDIEINRLRYCRITDGKRIKK
jgi:hypothetical protein